MVYIPITFSILYNIPKFFELETVYDYSSDNEINVAHITDRADGNKLNTDITSDVSLANCTDNTTRVMMKLGYRGTEMRLTSWYIAIYVFWSKFLLVQVIPWLTVVILNVSIWRKVREFQKIRTISLKKESGKFVYIW